MFCGSSLCQGLVCSVKVKYFLIILTCLFEVIVAYEYCFNLINCADPEEMHAVDLSCGNTVFKLNI